MATEISQEVAQDIMNGNEQRPTQYRNRRLPSIARDNLMFLRSLEGVFKNEPVRKSGILGSNRSKVTKGHISYTPPAESRKIARYDFADLVPMANESGYQLAYGMVNANIGNGWAGGDNWAPCIVLPKESASLFGTDKGIIAGRRAQSRAFGEMLVESGKFEGTQNLAVDHVISLYLPKRLEDGSYTTQTVLVLMVAGEYGVEECFGDFAHVRLAVQASHGVASDSEQPTETEPEPAPAKRTRSRKAQATEATV